MPDSFVRIVGLDGALSDLDKLPEDIVNDLFPGALAAGAAVIKTKLRARTPRSEDSTSSKKYGHLADDIHMTVFPARGLTATAHIGFGDTGYKAAMLEYGFRHPGKEHEFIQKPFIRPAADEAAEPAQDAFVESMIEQTK